MLGVLRDNFGVKSRILLTKRRPKGGEIFGRHFLGAESTKSTKRHFWGLEKKYIVSDNGK